MFLFSLMNIHLSSMDFLKGNAFFSKQVHQETNQPSCLPGFAQRTPGDSTVFSMPGFWGWKILVFFFVSRKKNTREKHRWKIWKTSFVPQVLKEGTTMAGTHFVKKIRAVRAVKTQTFAIVEVEESSWSFVIDTTCRKECPYYYTDVPYHRGVRCC